MEENHSSSFNGFLLEMDELISTDALLGGFVGDGSVDIHGRSVKRAHTGRWKASLFIIGVEIAERLAYAGILANLVIYLTDVKHDSTIAAATNVNVWNCVASMLPFIGAFVADSYLGRYWTITLSSVICLMEIAENNCVYRNEIHHAAGERTQILLDVASDPTLPRTKTVRCVVCNHGEAVFFQATARGEEGMALFFVCCNPNCGYRWRD